MYKSLILTDRNVDVCLCFLQVKSKSMFSGAACCGSRIPIEFHLEAGHLLYFYYESAMARHHFDTAVKLSGLDIHLTGYTVDIFF